jgi:hypothetical protein
MNANLGAPFATSVATDRLLNDARLAAADFLGCTAEEVVFGANTTTLNFLLAHALARTLKPGDEIIVTELDHDANVAPWLTEEAWLTMPPEPYEYQGRSTIAAFLRDRTALRGAPLLVPTRANTQPAFGCYFPSPHTDIARPAALLVLTLEGPRISAITWFGGSAFFPHFGLPRILR